MSRWRRLRLGLLIGLIPLVVLAVAGLWSTPEEGSPEANTCGSFIHRQSGSPTCVSDRIETYLVQVIAGVVIALAVAGVVYLVCTLGVWIRRGHRPTSRRRRVELTGAAAVVMVLGVSATVAVADHHGPDPCQPAHQPVAIARSDRVTLGFGDPGATGSTTITPPQGTLTQAWCAHAYLVPSPSGLLPIVSGDVLFATGSDDSRPRAIDLSTGRTRWRSGVVGDPAALDDGLLVVHGYNQVAALDPATGAVRWKTDDTPGAGASPSALTVSGTTVYATSDGIQDDRSWIRTFDLRTGRAERTYQFDDRQDLFMPPVVADGAVTVALNASPLVGLVPPTTTGGKLVSTPQSTRLVALDASDLRPRWRIDFPGQVDRLLAADGQVVAALAGTRGQSTVVAWSAASGQASWDHALSGDCSIEALVVAGPDLVVPTGEVGTDGCGTVAFAMATGLPAWRAGDIGSAWLSGSTLVGVDRLRVGPTTWVRTLGLGQPDPRPVASLSGRHIDTVVAGGVVLVSDTQTVEAFVHH